MFVDLVIEDEVTMNAIASGAQFSLSHLDGSRPVLQVWLLSQHSSVTSSPNHHSTQVGSTALFGTWKFTVRTLTEPSNFLPQNHFRFLLCSAVAALPAIILTLVLFLLSLEPTFSFPRPTAARSQPRPNACVFQTRDSAVCFFLVCGRVLLVLRTKLPAAHNSAAETAHF